MDGVVEIITGRERRWPWSVEQKLEVVAETYEPGARVGDVAARHGVCESLVFSWRRQVREGRLVAPEMAAFVPCRCTRWHPPPLRPVCPIRMKDPCRLRPVRRHVRV